MEAGASRHVRGHGSVSRRPGARRGADLWTRTNDEADRSLLGRLAGSVVHPGRWTVCGKLPCIVREIPHLVPHVLVADINGADALAGAKCSWQV